MLKMFAAPEEPRMGDLLEENGRRNAAKSPLYCLFLQAENSIRTPPSEIVFPKRIAVM